jgi:hypothetical protein
LCDARATHHLRRLIKGIRYLLGIRKEARAWPYAFDQSLLWW